MEKEKYISTDSKSNILTMVYIGLFLTLISCQKNTKEGLTLNVFNPLDFARTETVEIQTNDIKEYIEKYGTENLVVEDVSNGQILASQWIDLNGDSQMDQLIFQVEMTANGSKDILIRSLKEGDESVESNLTTYSRLVPERTDDYTWENDKVAFRTFGPEAQRRIEENEYGGTLSSGIDAWLKRVDYSIIDKWYKYNEEVEGSYHVDSGEGYDPYHVGSSRGIGGIGVWEEDSLYISRNFVSCKTIATGPIRTVFELTYAPWKFNNGTVEETKRISLDLGSNLSRFESTLTGEKGIPNATIGITLHDYEGEVSMNPEQGWFRYWEPMDGSKLGLGVVIDPKQIQQSLVHRAAYPDGSQLLVVSDLVQDKVIYYAGFGWDQAGDYQTKEDWDNYLFEFSLRLKEPLKLTLK